jgi:hypothetical protein
MRKITAIQTIAGARWIRVRQFGAMTRGVDRNIKVAVESGTAAS